MPSINTDKRFKRPEDLEQRLADMVGRRLSQYRMARELGVSRMTVRNWLDEYGYHLHSTYVQIPGRG